MKEVTVECGSDRKPITVCFHSDADQMGDGACVQLLQTTAYGGDVHNIVLPLEAVEPLRRALKGVVK